MRSRHTTRSIDVWDVGKLSDFYYVDSDSGKFEPGSARITALPPVGVARYPRCAPGAGVVSLSFAVSLLRDLSSFDSCSLYFHFVVVVVGW